ncbi:MAG: hypothetical protein HY039_08950 [Nitrospirae bacterium]|nr:hypothetical protein [Nitrospirota bacterium]
MTDAEIPPEWLTTRPVDEDERAERLMALVYGRVKIVPRTRGDEPEVRCPSATVAKEAAA